MNSESRVHRRHVLNDEMPEEKIKDADNGKRDTAIEQAYRNGAANLAASAWGDDGDHRQNSPGTFRNKGNLGRLTQDTAASLLNCVTKTTSAFHLIAAKRDPSSPDTSEINLVNEPSRGEEDYKRSPKVPKASYADQGSHAKQSPLSENLSNRNESRTNMNPAEVKHENHNNNILKSLIYSVEETYGRIKLVNLNECNDEEKVITEPEFSSAQTKETEKPPNDSNSHPKPKGRSGLHMALASKTEQTRNVDPTNVYLDLPRGKCLSSPSVPVSNHGKDNSEGNMIVYVNDILSIPKSMVHYQSSRMESNFEVGSAANSDNIDFLVLGLLGQGTFAQVFKCKNLQTNEMMALKIVKSKPAYTRQAGIEIDIFRSLSSDLPVTFVREQQQRFHQNRQRNSSVDDSGGETNMVQLLCYFMYHKHLCLAFELLGLNLYEVLKINQFRGLSIRVVQTIVRQALLGVKKLSQHNIVHCDLKPENILLFDNKEIASISSNGDFSNTETKINVEGSKHKKKTSNHFLSIQYQPRIKLIDFGSACFAGQTTHTYIQSRFYRSPEVLVGLPYDSAIDMWSLGCVAAELFLGLPILPGVHEHDQLSRICEMISPIPDWMVEQGSKSEKYFLRANHSLSLKSEEIQDPDQRPSQKRPSMSWRLKTRQEFIAYLSEKERGKHEKLDQQPNRYFKRKRLSDIVSLHGHYCQNDDKILLRVFIHFLEGILDPDPWLRWTAHQASMHPFVTGDIREAHIRSKDFKWFPSWDPKVCDRRLLASQKRREKKELLRHDTTPRSSSSGSSKAQAVASNSINASSVPQILHNGGRLPDLSIQSTITGAEVSAESSATTRVTAMAESMSLSHSYSSQGVHLSAGNQSFTGRESSPPPLLGFHNVSGVLNPPYHNAGSYPLHSHLPGSLNGSMYSQDNRMYIQPVTASNYLSTTTNVPDMNRLANNIVETQYPPPMILSPTMQSLNRAGQGDYYSMHHLPPLPGPQSFSGVYYDRTSQHLPVEGDLGYALQRPGVVPSMENENHISHSYVPQHHQLSNEMHKNSTNRRTSFSGDTSNSKNMSHSSSKHPINALYQPPQDRKETVEPPTHIYEHDQNNFKIDATTRDKSENDYIPSSGARTTGLLAQQLADHSAAMQEPNESTSKQNHHLPNNQKLYHVDVSNQQHHPKPTFYPQHAQAFVKPGSHGSTMAQPPANFYGYAPPNLPPYILSSTAPSGTDPRVPTYHANVGQYSGSHGSLHSTIQHSEGWGPVPVHIPPQMRPPYPIVDERTLQRGKHGSSNIDGNVFSPPSQYVYRNTTT